MSERDGRLVEWRFLALLAGGSALLAIPAWFLVGDVDGGRSGLVAGMAFSLASVALGFHWIRWSAARDGRTFLVAVMGSMLARVIGLLVFALALAFATAVSLVVALLTVVAMHVVFGFVEIGYFHRTEAIG